MHPAPPWRVISLGKYMRNISYNLYNLQYVVPLSQGDKEKGDNAEDVVISNRVINVTIDKIDLLSI